MKIRKARKKDLMAEKTALEQGASVPEQVEAQSVPFAPGDSGDEQLKKEFVAFKVRALLHRIDHTLLKQDCTEKEIDALCDEANEYGFYAVCVQPLHVAAAKKRLGEDSHVKVATVVGFPMGETYSAVKAKETKMATAAGADEIDMVACISAIKRGEYRYVRRDVARVVKAAKNAGRDPSKVSATNCSHCRA